MKPVEVHHWPPEITRLPGTAILSHSPFYTSIETLMHFSPFASETFEKYPLQFHSAQYGSVAQ